MYKYSMLFSRVYVTISLNGRFMNISIILLVRGCCRLNTVIGKQEMQKSSRVKLLI
ncbi:MAG: hypothetical protein QM793_10195 [Muricomes sp.]